MQRWVGIPISDVFFLPISEKTFDFRFPTFRKFRFPALPISDTSDCSYPPLIRCKNTQRLYYIYNFCPNPSRNFCEIIKKILNQKLIYLKSPKNHLKSNIFLFDCISKKASTQKLSQRVAHNFHFFSPYF